MASLRESLIRAARQGAANTLGIADGLDELFDVPNDTFPFLGALDDWTDRARAGARQLLTPGPDETIYPPGGGQPTFPPPPQGQCPVVYTATYEWIDPIFGSGVQSFTQNILGPNVRMDLGGTQIGEIALIRVISDVAQGQVQRSYQITEDRPPIELVSFVAVRADGQPDVCPEQDPPPPPFVDDPITYDPPSGPPITISPKFEFFPIDLDINGNLSIPIKVTTVDADYNMSVNLNTGDTSFNFNFGGGGGSACCPPATTQEDPPPSIEPEPEPDEELEIVGVIAKVTSISDEAQPTRIVTDSGYELLFPDAGLVTFLVKVDEQLTWSSPVRVQRSSQFVPVPPGAVAIDCDQVARTGVSLSLTKVYATITQAQPGR